jgi:hypothetical protein
MLSRFDKYIQMILEETNLIGVMGKTDDDGEVAYAYVYDHGVNKTHGDYFLRNFRGSPSAARQGAFHWRYATKSQILYYWPNVIGGHTPIGELMEYTKMFLDRKGFKVNTISRIEKRELGEPAQSYRDAHRFE